MKKQKQLTHTKRVVLLQALLQDSIKLSFSKELVNKYRRQLSIEQQEAKEDRRKCLVFVGGKNGNNKTEGM